MLGSVEGERRDDRESAWADGRVHGLDVPPTIRLRNEKVKHGAVVPKVVLAMRMPVEYVLVESDNRRVTESLPNLLQRRRRDVEHGEIGEMLLDEVVNEQRRTASNVDYRSVRRNPQRLDQLQGHFRYGLIPTHTFCAAGCVSGVPMTGSLVDTRLIGHTAI